MAMNSVGLFWTNEGIELYTVELGRIFDGVPQVGDSIRIKIGNESFTLVGQTPAPNNIINGMRLPSIAAIWGLNQERPPE